MRRTISPKPQGLLNRRRRRRGVQAIEFALCLPVWLIAMSGIFDFGWLVFQMTSLDAAVNMGCREGSLVDPGEWDEHTAEVYAAAEAKTWEFLATVGGGSCEDCSFTGSTEGSYPRHSLVCEVDTNWQPLIGVVITERVLTVRQAVRMEWQYEPM